MASGMSEEYIKRTYIFPHMPVMHIRVKLRKVINCYRWLCRRLACFRLTQSLRTNCSIVSNLDGNSAHFKKNGWVFVKGFFNTEFHRDLVSNWPGRHYFEPPRSVLKGYDTLQIWRQAEGYVFPYAQLFPELVELASMLSGEKFTRKIMTLSGSTVDLHTTKVGATRSYTDTGVVPHTDDIARKGKSAVNCILIIGATGGHRSGGLILSRDNEQKDIIFEPDELTNTCLIYDTHAPFFHGFPPIARGNYRWMVSC